MGPSRCGLLVRRLCSQASPAGHVVSLKWCGQSCRTLPSPLWHSPGGKHRVPDHYLPHNPVHPTMGPSPPLTKGPD